MLQIHGGVWCLLHPAGKEIDEWCSKLCKELGYPLLSIPEGCQVLAEARMYYELKRENKKLRF